MKGEDGGCLLYHLVHNKSLVQSCFAKNVKDEAEIFTVFPLPYLLHQVRLNGGIDTGQHKMIDEIKKSYTTEIVRRATNSKWDNSTKRFTEQVVACLILVVTLSSC